MSADAEKIHKMAHNFVMPHFERLKNIPKEDEDALRDEAIRLCMSLGYAMAMVGQAFWSNTDPAEFAKHMADYVKSGREFLAKEMAKTGGNGESATGKKKDSVWD